MAKKEEVQNLTISERLQRAKEYRLGLQAKANRKHVIIDLTKKTVDEFIESVLSAFESIPDECKEHAEIDISNACIYYEREDNPKSGSPELEREIRAIDAQNKKILHGGNVNGYQNIRGVNPQNAHVRK